MPSCLACMPPPCLPPPVQRHHPAGRRRRWRRRLAPPAARCLPAGARLQPTLQQTATCVAHSTARVPAAVKRCGSSSAVCNRPLRWLALVAELAWTSAPFGPPPARQQHPCPPARMHAEHAVVALTVRSSAGGRCAGRPGRTARRAWNAAAPGWRRVPARAPPPPPRCGGTRSAPPRAAPTWRQGSCCTAPAGACAAWVPCRKRRGAVGLAAAAAAAHGYADTQCKPIRQPSKLRSPFGKAPGLASQLPAKACRRDVGVAVCSPAPRRCCDCSCCRCRIRCCWRGLCRLALLGHAAAPLLSPTDVAPRQKAAANIIVYYAADDRDAATPPPCLPPCTRC